MALNHPHRLLFHGKPNQPTNQPNFLGKDLQELKNLLSNAPRSEIIENLNFFFISWQFRHSPKHCLLFVCFVFLKNFFGLFFEIFQKNSFCYFEKFLEKYFCLFLRNFFFLKKFGLFFESFHSTRQNRECQTL